MLNQKQFGCLKCLTVNFKLENQKGKIFFWNDTDHGPDMGFYGPLVGQSEWRNLKSHTILFGMMLSMHAELSRVKFVCCEVVGHRRHFFSEGRGSS